MISDTNLREEFGHLIGKLAKSHSKNINYIEKELNQSYTSPKYNQWVIDFVKLAFILRTADAAHIDNLRTPKTNKMIGQIVGDSKNHWTFQKKLGFPTIIDDLLVYSSNNPFEVNEQKAWWFCYDALSVLDKELKSAHQYFQINKKNGFKAKGVKSIDNTLELGKKYIRTFQWESVNSTIKVSNPVHIAAELGGKKLYQQISYSIRELLQNSIDAINLYRFNVGKYSNDFGEIEVSITKENNLFYLSVLDNGIGMSEIVLANDLLDFGGSYWRTNRFTDDYTGIKSKGFESIGQFGIGFFSIFMIGTNVTVTSWKYGDDKKSMKTLDFFDGLNSSPILREPSIEEKNKIIGNGTYIKIQLDKDPNDKLGFFNDSIAKVKDLFTLVKYFAPSANVKIKVQELDGIINFLNPDSLKTKNLNDTLDFLYIGEGGKKTLMNKVIQFTKEVNPPFLELKDESISYGKLAIMPRLGNVATSSLAVIHSKGIRVSSLPDLIGHFEIDKVTTIIRNSYSKILPYQVAKNWVIEQKKFFSDKPNIYPYYLKLLNGLILSFNLFNEDNFILGYSKISNHSTIFWTVSDFRDYLKNNNLFNFYSCHEVKIGYKYEYGFTNMYYSNPLRSIIRDIDSEKIIDYKTFIESIIIEVWGSFKKDHVDTFESGNHSISDPYNSKDIYQKC